MAAPHLQLVYSSGDMVAPTGPPLVIYATLDIQVFCDNGDTAMQAYQDFLDGLQNLAKGINHVHPHFEIRVGELVENTNP